MCAHTSTSRPKIDNFEASALVFAIVFVFILYGYLSCSSFRKTHLNDDDEPNVDRLLDQLADLQARINRDDNVGSTSNKTNKKNN